MAKQSGILHLTNDWVSRSEYLENAKGKQALGQLVLDRINAFMGKEADCVIDGHTIATVPGKQMASFRFDSFYRPDSNPPRPAYYIRHPNYNDLTSPLVDVYLNGRIEDLHVGDVVSLPWVANYQHGATMQITEIKRRTFMATEIGSSYGAGRQWNLHCETPNLKIATHYMSDERLQELSDLWD